MKKYLLLVIPIFFYRELFRYFNLEALINLIIVMICLTFLFKRTALRNVLDLFIAICFTIYFCILYSKTVELKGIVIGFSHSFSFENAKNVFDTVNLIPIKGIFEVITQNISNLNVLYQVFGNTIMLAPFAFALLYFEWTKSYKQAIWYTLLCTVGIEFIQFVLSLYYSVFEIGLRRSIDIDDVILNTIGAGIGIGGYYLWSIIETQFKR
ncbi:MULTISPECIES: VanZ family protein [Halobacillus]|uniref:VanZ family protein n=1 Tax=Halobacillus TaxID=45667 RepID=UPI0009A65CA0|nr:MULTISPECIES: VanZ family protein [Halobacillus]